MTVYGMLVETKVTVYGMLWLVETKMTVYGML